jgi:hypothetical protein
VRLLSDRAQLAAALSPCLGLRIDRPPGRLSRKFLRV